MLCSVFGCHSRGPLVFWRVWKGAGEEEREKMSIIMSNKHANMTCHDVNKGHIPVKYAQAARNQRRRFCMCFMHYF